MKNLSSSSSILLLFFFLFSTKSSFLGVTNAEPVLDSDGEEVIMGSKYYVVSAIRGVGGGGLDLGSPMHGQCPKFVIQRTGDTQFGRPVTFWPVDTNASVVHQSTDLNIQFVPGRDSYCRQSTAWKLDDCYDHSTGKWWVTTGANRGKPGANTLTNWFKIEKMEGTSDYKFRFCPSVCDSCISLCGDIDKDVYQYGQTRLTLSSQAWPWYFVKASRVIKQVA